MPQNPHPMPQGQPYNGAAAFPNPYAGSGKRTTWIAVGTALAIVIAAFVGLRAAGVLKVGATDPKLESLKAEGNDAAQDILKANGQDPKQDILRAEGNDPKTPLLTAQGSTGPATLDRPATRIAMPDDIRKWLEHLERIEKRKNDLSLKQVANMMVLMKQMQVLGADPSALLDEDSDSTPPADKARGEFNDLKPEWNQLIRDFQSYPPPAECKPIADNYSRAINEIPGMMSDIADILQNAASNPQDALQKAYKLQNTSANVIDKYLGETDSGVGAICSKYDTSKWFSIKTDVGGGALMKFGM